MPGLLAKKIGMTRILDVNGNLVPVTVLSAGPVTVTRILTSEANGYNALQVGFEDVKESRVNKPSRKNFEKQGVKPKRILKEFRISAEEIKNFKVGQEIGADLFQEGEFVDVRGRTIGKGFQGNIRRWGQKGGPDSHGSMYHRRTGSAGASSFPSRTWPGHRLPGRMGGTEKTTQNLLVMKVLKEDNALLVKGAVPGARHTLLTVQKALKRHDKIDLTKPKAVKASIEKTAKKTAKKK